MDARSADLFLSVRIQSGFQERWSIRDREIAANNNAIIILWTVPLLCSRICRDAHLLLRSEFSFSLVLFFYRFNSLFLIFFFFFSIYFHPTSSTDRTVFYDFDTQTSVIIFFFFLASPNNREPRYGIVYRFLCVCFFFLRKFRRGFALSSRRWQIVESLSEKNNEIYLLWCFKMKRKFNISIDFFFFLFLFHVISREV